MRAPSTAAKVIGLLLLLPAGAVVLFLVAGLTKHRYDDSGFGSFHGVVDAKLLYFGSNHSFSVAIEGRSPARWCWVRPTNYQYDVLSFDGFGEDRKGHGQIHTSSMTLTVDSNTVPISKASLSDLLYGLSPSDIRQEDVEAIDFVERFILDAGKGRLAAPRHHGYHFETPVGGMMVHFSLGSRFPYSLYWWIGVWCILCLWVVARAWTRQAANDDQCAAAKVAGACIFMRLVFSRLSSSRSGAHCHFAQFCRWPFQAMSVAVFPRLVTAAIQDEQRK